MSLEKAELMADRDLRKMEEECKPSRQVETQVRQGLAGDGGKRTPPSKDKIGYVVKSNLPYYDREDKDDYIYLAKKEDIEILINELYELFGGVA